MDRKIYLARHGSINCGKEKSYIGITDLPLSLEGIIQAENLKKFFKDIDLEKVYSSPLKRCIETSNIILEDRYMEKILVEELKEINMGEWEGKSFDYIKSFFSEEYNERGEKIDTFMPPKGESFIQLQNRVIPVLEEIAKNSSGNILIVSHAGVNRVILSKLLCFPLKEIFKILQPYGCVNELVLNKQNEKWQWKMAF